MSKDAPKPKVGTRGLSNTIFDTALASGALMVITLLTGIALARILGPDGRGIYASAQFWAKLGPAFLTFSIFEASVIRLRTRVGGTKGRDAETHLPSLILISTVLTVLAILVAVVAVSTGLVSVDGISSGVLLAFTSAILAIAIFARAFQCVETANLRFGMLNVERVMSPFLFLIAVLAMWFAEWQMIALFLGAFVLTTLPALVMRTYRFRHHIIGRVDLKEITASVRLGWRINLSRAAVSLAGEADRLVLVPLWSAQMLGFYFVAMSTCGAALSLAGQALQMTLLPSLSGLPKEEKRRKIEQLIRLSTIVAIAVMLGLWITAPTLVPLVFGEDFRPAVIYVQGLAFTSVLKPILSIINIAHISEEKTMPGVCMALAFVATFGAGYLFTDFDKPMNFFIALGLANAASVAIGMGLLARNGLLRLDRQIIAGPADVMFMFSTMQKYALNIIRRNG